MDPVKGIEVWRGVAAARHRITHEHGCLRGSSWSVTGGAREAAGWEQDEGSPSGEANVAMLGALRGVHETRRALVDTTECRTVTVGVDAAINQMLAVVVGGESRPLSKLSLDSRNVAVSSLPGPTARPR